MHRAVQADLGGTVFLDVDRREVAKWPTRAESDVAERTGARARFQTPLRAAKLQCFDSAATDDTVYFDDPSQQGFLQLDIASPTP